MIESKITRRGYALVVQSLDQLAPKILEAAQRGLADGLLKTVGVVQREFLMGPRPAKLGEVTTRLRQSIASEAVINGQTVTGKIGSNVRYAAFHEFGFHGTEHVHSFNRVIERFTGIGGTFGGRNAKGQYIGSGGRKAASEQTSGAVGFETIRAHDRLVDYAGRPFVSPALKKSIPMIIDGVKAELAKITP